MSAKGKKNAYNEEYKAIIDDNTFPRHLWCFLANGKTYSGPNWKNSGLGEFELAHVFTHKESEIDFEKQFFKCVREALYPYGDFSCACNVVLLPKGTVRPTDNSITIKAAFFISVTLSCTGRRRLMGVVSSMNRSFPIGMANYSGTNQFYLKSGNQMWKM